MKNGYFQKNVRFKNISSMIMGDAEFDEHLRIFKCLIDTGSHVLRNAMEIKLLKNITFVQYLETNKHQYYHQFEKNIRRKCCLGIPHGCIVKGFMDKNIFNKVYNKTAAQNTHDCLDRFEIKASISLDILDLSDLNFFLWNSGKLSTQEENSLMKIMSIRSAICHPSSSHSYSINELKKYWSDLKSAVLMFAEQKCYKDIVEIQIETLQNCKLNVIESERIIHKMKTESDKILHAIQQNTPLKIADIEKLVKDGNNELENCVRSENNKTKSYINDTFQGFKESEQRVCQTVIKSRGHLENKIIEQQNEIRSHTVELNADLMEENRKLKAEVMEMKTGMKELKIDMKELKTILIGNVGKQNVNLVMNTEQIEKSTNSPDNRKVDITVKVNQTHVTEDKENKIIENLPPKIKILTNNNSSTEAAVTETIEITGKKVNSIILELKATPGILHSVETFKAAMLTLVQNIQTAGEIEVDIEDTVTLNLRFESPLTEAQIAVVECLFAKERNNDNNTNQLSTEYSSIPDKSLSSGGVKEMEFRPELDTYSQKGLQEENSKLKHVVKGLQEENSNLKGLQEKNSQLENVVKGVMSAQLRRSARRRKNMPAVAAASARKKANQGVPATTSLPAPQLPSIDSAIIPTTSSAGISTMSYSKTGAGVYTSASRCPVDSMSTAYTPLYSKVPDQRVFNTVTSQDPPEHSLGVMSAQLRRSARRRKNMPTEAAASARKKAKQIVPAITSVPAQQLPTVDSAIILANSSAGIYQIPFSQTGAGSYTSASTCPVASMSTAYPLLYSRVPDQREFNTVTSQDPPGHSLANMNQNSRNDEDENDSLVDQSEDGGIIISNNDFGQTIRQFEQTYTACLDRRKTHEQYILNIRYPDKTSDEYMEYLENSRYCNKDYLALTKNDLKKRYLYQNLVTTVGTEIDMRNRQQLFIILDMIRNNRKISSTVTQISSGSFAEGLVLPGSDTDIMFIIEDVDVKQDASNIENPIQLATFVMEPDNDHPGFTRLRLIAGKDKESQFINSETFESITTNVYLSPKKFISNIHQHLPELSLHGPCLSDEDQNWDFAFCIRIKYLPHNAMPWVSRYRQQWPPSSIIDMISKNGCLLVAVGPRALSESSLLWRVSFSLAEKQLVHSFNYTQLLCYCLLKLALKHIVNKNDHAKDLLCSYFLKTALFWVSEEVDIDTFQLSKLSICFSHCLNRLILWVNKCFCPNYFVPEHNMFQGKISPDNNTILTSILNSIKDGGVDGLLYTLFPHDNTKNESSLIKLEFLFYRISWAHAMTDDDSLYFKTLEVIESLIKSRSSKFIIDVCKFRHASISQFAAQQLPPLSTISETYNTRKRYHELLQDGLNTDAVSGWLLYASYYYVTGQFNVTLKLTDKVLEKCSPEMLLMGLGNYSEKNISNYRNHVHSTMTMCEKMRKAFICDVRYIKGSSLIPAELQLEVKDKDIFIPPDVMSHCLRVLCYHHLGDISNRQKSLDDFLKDVRLHRPGTCSNSITILGVCCEISGEDRSAYQFYDDALHKDGHICCSALLRKKKLLNRLFGENGD